MVQFKIKILMSGKDSHLGRAHTGGRCERLKLFGHANGLALSPRFLINPYYSSIYLLKSSGVNYYGQNGGLVNHP